jgi:G3E family GTPase
MRDLLSRRDRGVVPMFRRMVVESTGLADPFPILSTLRADPVLRHHVRAGSVITTIDAVNGLPHIDRHQESIQQIAAADQLVLTKTDLAEEASITQLLDRIRRINPDAPMVRANEATISLLSDRPRTFGRALNVSEPVSHADRIRSFVVIQQQPIDWTAFGVWLTMLLNRHGDRVLRVKGILNLAGETAPVAIHGVRYLVHNPVHMTGWPDDDRRSRIVFIVDGLDPDLVRRSLAAFTRPAETPDIPGNA